MKVMDHVCQGIETKYMGATNHRGSRVKATAYAGSITVGWDHGLDVNANHARAAAALCEKLGWSGVLIGSSRPDGCGNMYALVKPDQDGAKDCLVMRIGVEGV